MPISESYLRVVRTYNGQTFYVTIQSRSTPVGSQQALGVEKVQAVRKPKTIFRRPPQPLEASSPEFIPLLKGRPVEPLTISKKIEVQKLNARSLKNRKNKLIRAEKKQQAAELQIAQEKVEKLKETNAFKPEVEQIEIYSKPTLKVQDEVTMRLQELIERFRSKYTKLEEGYEEDSDMYVVSRYTKIPWTYSCALRPIPKGAKRSRNDMARRKGIEADLLQLWSLLGRELRRKVLPQSVSKEFCRCGYCMVEETPPWERKNPCEPVKWPYADVPPVQKEPARRVATAKEMQDWFKKLKDKERTGGKIAKRF